MDAFASFTVGFAEIATIVVMGVVVIWTVKRWRRGNRENRSLAERIRREDTLKHLCKCEANGLAATVASVAGTLQLDTASTTALLAEMEQRGLVSFLAGELQLTTAGRESGLHILRAHRLWETHLAHETAVHPSEWHAQAEEREHLLSPEETLALAARLGHPAHDPHGAAIPQIGEKLPAETGMPLNTLAIGDFARVVHIQDEPELIRAQLAAEGLHLGTTLRLLDKNERCLRFWSDAAEHELAPIIAHHVDVLPLPEDESELEETTLAGLREGERGKVLGLAQACRGSERQRLLDLGFVRGSDVSAEIEGPTGDPTAYQVRGTVIALRREQAQLVRVAVARIGDVGDVVP